MQINSINSYSNQQILTSKPQFRARFSESTLKNLIETEKASVSLNHGNRCELMPKLYTLLKRLDEIEPGKKAFYSYKTFNGDKMLGVQIGGPDGQHLGFNSKTLLNFLEEALVAGNTDFEHACNKSSALYVGRAFMPKSVYEQEWWSNRNKTLNDIIRDFSYYDQNEVVNL